MKVTSAEANKLIKQLKDQYRMLYTQEGNDVSFIAAATKKRSVWKSIKDHSLKHMKIRWKTTTDT